MILRYFAFGGQKISAELASTIGVIMEEDEKGCHLKLSDQVTAKDTHYYQAILKVLLLGEYSDLSDFFDNKFERDNINTFINELSHSRRFWLKIEELICNL